MTIRDATRVRGSRRHRRRCAVGGAGSGADPFDARHPSSGERLPAVGLGSAQVFNTNDDATRQTAGAVSQALTAADGSVVDTASVYGDAEAVLGDVIATRF